MRRSMRERCQIRGCAALSPLRHIFSPRRLVCAKSRGRNRRLTVEICGRDWRGTTMIPTIAFVAGMTPGCILGLKIGLFQTRSRASRRLGHRLCAFRRRVSAESCRRVCAPRCLLAPPDPAKPAPLRRRDRLPRALRPRLRCCLIRPPPRLLPPRLCLLAPCSPVVGSCSTLARANRPDLGPAFSCAAAVDPQVLVHPVRRQPIPVLGLTAPASAASVLCRRTPGAPARTTCSRFLCPSTTPSQSRSASRLLLRNVFLARRSALLADAAVAPPVLCRCDARPHPAATAGCPDALTL